MSHHSRLGETREDGVKKVDLRNHAKHVIYDLTSTYPTLVHNEKISTTGNSLLRMQLPIALSKFHSLFEDVMESFHLTRIKRQLTKMALSANYRHFSLLCLLLSTCSLSQAFHGPHQYEPYHNQAKKPTINSIGQHKSSKPFTFKINSTTDEVPPPSLSATEKVNAIKNDLVRAREAVSPNKEKILQLAKELEDMGE